MASAFTGAAPAGVVAAAPETKGQPEEELDYFLHPVQEGDTLTRLAVRYGVSQATIKRFNQFQLLGEHLDHVRTVRIPRSPNAQPPPPASSDQDNHQYRLVKLFCQTTGGTEAEARFYLTEADWQMKAAVQEFREDRAWEEQQGASAHKRFSKTIRV
eukprot:TRINITY_DN15172_c0_g1_i1.p1 TRINITY_DN15172_c0_g1~~TRINITY_DN15172_c0_g1_i1.p1  ORF type:complete len:157 (-),score=32.60 TRINITY_DN15172_c0_g1_i1:134-604(-)